MQCESKTEWPDCLKRMDELLNDGTVIDRYNLHLADNVQML